MSAPEPTAPPTGEEIHLPGNSLLPVLTAAGITTTLIGITTTVILVIAGGILTLACIALWIADARREIDELPLDHS